MGTVQNWISWKKGVFVTRGESSAMVTLGVLLITVTIVYGQAFNCDSVNQNFCLCTKGDGETSWDVACPAKFLEVYPVMLKTESLKSCLTTIFIQQSPFNPFHKMVSEMAESILILSPYHQEEEASLRIICDPTLDEFKWPLIQGFDLGHNVTFDVTSLEISYCPFISTEDLKTLFSQIKLDPEDLMSFTYHTWRQNTKLPSDFLTFMPNLEAIDLSGNKLHFLPQVHGLQYLTQLNLRGNLITSISKDSFKTNKNLQEIRLAGNRLTTIDSVFPASLRLLDVVSNNIASIRSFGRLDHLEQLYLNNNPLTNISPGAFNELKSLSELSMDSSKLFTLPVLKNLPKLMNLSISYSLFTSTQLMTTQEPYGLATEVVVSTDNPNFYSGTTPRDDQLVFDSETDAEETTANVLRARHSLDQLENQYERKYNAQESSQEELIGNLISLKKLILINDDLKTLNWLGYLPNLTDLILTRNSIKEIPQGFFSNLPSVVHVDMSRNALNGLTDLNAPNMAYLDLSNNFIFFIDKLHLSSLKKLRLLSLASNKIEYVHPKAFENLRELVILDMSNNLISTFNQGLPIVSRSVVYPSYRNDGESGKNEDDSGLQQESPFQYCEKLERINLKNNLITRMFSDWMFLLPSLSILDVSHNKLKSVSPRDLHFIARNIRVDMRFNEIREIDMDFAEVLLEPAESNRHVAVLLDGNPLHCDCHALAFKRWSIPSYALQYTDNLRCHTPTYLHGNKFRDLSENDLTCTLEENCPKGCNCIELPSENLIKINCYSGAYFKEFGASLRQFTEDHESYEFEINLSGRKLHSLNESFVQEISQQIRFINLTGNKLKSLDFLDTIAERNNVTKFSLAQNPFQCDGCKFQQIWWRHYQRMSDIRSVTCVPGVGGKEISFYELVKDTVCVEELLSSEVRLLIILLGIFTPLVILAIACCTKQKRHNKEIKQKKAAAEVAAKTRTFKPPRSKVVELDHSKF